MGLTASEIPSGVDVRDERGQLVATCLINHKDGQPVAGVIMRAFKGEPDAITFDYRQLKSAAGFMAEREGGNAHPDWAPVRPHDYWPDLMAMGDCRLCGHRAEAAHHIFLGAREMPGPAAPRLPLEPAGHGLLIESEDELLQYRAVMREGGE